jgi:hypothetical protein
MMIFGTIYLFSTLSYASEPWKCTNSQDLGEMKLFVDSRSDPNELGDTVESIGMFFVNSSNLAEPCKILPTGITDCEEIVDVHYENYTINYTSQSGTTTSNEDNTMIYINISSNGTEDWDNLEYVKNILTSNEMTNVQWTASWTGTIADYPEFVSPTFSYSQQLTTGDASSNNRNFSSTTNANSPSSCSWSILENEFGREEQDAGRFSETFVDIDTNSGNVLYWDGSCGEGYTTQTGYFNGEYQGELDVDWNIVGPDNDQDGWSAASGDWNDEDDQILACTEEQEEEVIEEPEDSGLEEKEEEDTGVQQEDTGEEGGPKEGEMLCAMTPLDLSFWGVLWGLIFLSRRRTD